MKISFLRDRAISTFSAVLGLALLVLAAGCDDNPTTVVVQNDYPATVAVGSAMTVFKVWWVTTLFPNPVVPGAISESERTIPGTDFAYALVAPGWSPDSGVPPARLIALKSTQALTASAHQQLTLSVSDQDFAGNCAAGSSLTADGAQLVTERIFPGSFSGLSYDPATCTTAPIAADAGAPADATQPTDGAAD